VDDIWLSLNTQELALAPVRVIRRLTAGSIARQAGDGGGGSGVWRVRQSAHPATSQKLEAARRALAVFKPALLRAEVKI